MRFGPTFLGAALAIALLAPAAPSPGQPSIVLQPLFTSLTTPPARSPVGLAHAGDGSGRLFVVIQEGEILVHAGGQVLGMPFLDIRSEILCCGERGLLGLAFHPQYESNGFFFVYYTDLSGANVLARYRVSATDPTVADPASRAILFTDAQPGSNHNGGQLGFGPDGFLYIAKGEGGGAANAQSLGTRLGKILRIQPSLGPTPPFYTAPDSNPFFDTPGALPEIWAFGFRNPWRFSFDRLTGDLFIADVGETQREEVDFQPAGSPGGENYGWSIMEGSLCFGVPTNCNPNGTLVLPILEYGHNLGCSITGGFRYRGTASPALFGLYFYGDFCTGRIWAASEAGGAWTSNEALDTALNISSFGEGEDGEVYVVHRGGAVYRIAASDGSAPDLLIEGLSLSAGTVAPGGQVTVNYSVANRGSSTVSQTYTDRIHLSTNATLGGDVLLGPSHGHTVVLPPGVTHAHSQAVTIPAGTTPGNYFILIEADALTVITESNEGNNVTAIPVTVSGGPDLVVEALTLSSASVAAGGPVTVNYQIANRGTTTVSAVYTDRMYLSTNTILGPADTLLGASHGHTVVLPPGATHAHSQAVTIPAGTAPSNYFILVQADALAVIAEGNEGNNVGSIPLTVTPP